MAVTRLHRAWGYVETAPGVARLWSVRSRRQFQVRGPDRLASMLAVLRHGVVGETAADDLSRQAQTTRPQAAELLGALSSLGALISDDRREEHRAALGPQIEFLEIFDQDDRAGELVQRRLATTTVILLGLGGLGSWCAVQLALAGIGHLIAIDDDTVEHSNLGRQILYHGEDAMAARPKVLAAQPALARLNPDLRYTPVQRRVTAAADLEGWLAGADLLVLGFGNGQRHRTRDLAARASAACGVAFLTLGLYSVGPLCVPGSTGCFRCIAGDLSGVDPRGHTLPSAAQYVPAVRFVPWAAVATGYAVDEAVRHLTGFAGAQTIGAYLEIDPLSQQVTRHAGDRDPQCPICSTKGAS